LGSFTFIAQDLWKDDMAQWQDILYGDVYSWLIETKDIICKGEIKSLYIRLQTRLTILFVDTSALSIATMLGTALF